MSEPEKGSEKPTLSLMLPETAEDFAEMFEQLTGRKPTPEEMEELREECKDLQQRDAERAQDNAAPPSRLGCSRRK